MKIINLAFAALFLASAALQWNDPDPLRWMAVYVFTAAVCAFAAFKKWNRWLLWTGVAACVAWLAVWLPEFTGWLKMGAPDIAAEMKATAPHIEYAREFFGLALCLGVLAWQLFQSKKQLLAVGFLPTANSQKPT